MINLARICVVLSQKSSIVLAFSMIRFKSSDFHKFTISRFIIFIKFSTLSIRESFSKFFIQMRDFSCMSSGACEIGTQMMIVWLIFIKFLIFLDSSSSDFHQVHDLFSFIIFRWRFLKFVIQMKFFSCMPAGACEMSTQVMIVWLIFTDFADFHQVPDPSDSLSPDFHQVHDPPKPDFSPSPSFKHSGDRFWNLSYWWNFLINVSRCMRKRHLHAIIGIIGRWTAIRLLMSPIWCSSMVECSPVWCSPMVECPPGLMPTDGWMPTGLMLIDGWMPTGFDAHRWLNAHRVWCSPMVLIAERSPYINPIWVSNTGSRGIPI